MEMLLNTVRKVDNDQLREYTSGDNNSLQEKLAIGIFNPEDMENLIIKENSRVKMSSKFGSVIVNVKQDKNVPKGTIIMPVSIWSNQITGVENKELVFKNIEAKVESTQEPVLSFEDILNSIKGN